MLLGYTASQTRRVFIDGGEVVFLEIRIINQDLFFRGPRREPLQYVPHRYTESPNARLTGTLARLDGDAVASHDALRRSYRESGLLNIGSPLRRHPADALHRFQDVFEGTSVAEAQVAVALGAETLAVETGDAAFVQEIVGERLRIHAGAFHIRENIEGARGHGEAETGNGIQAFNDRIAAALEFGHHGVDGILRSLKRF